MGQPEKPLTPEKGPAHLWGFELRAWRKRRDMSQADLGAEVHCDPGYVYKIEHAKRRVPLTFAIACDQVLSTEGALVRLHQAFLNARGEVASPAPHVANPAPHVANPGSVIVPTDTVQESSSDEGISVPCRLRDGQVTFVTIPRRAFLRNGAALGTLAALGAGTSAQGVLLPGHFVTRTAAYGSTPVEHLRKLRRLLIDSDNLLGPRQAIAAVHEQVRVTQALRADAGNGDRRELLRLQTQFAELASWLHQDLGEHQNAEYWLDRALQWSHVLGDNDLTAYVMARKSQLAGESGDLVDVVDLAEASRQMTHPRSRLAAVGLTYQAFGHALRGEATASQKTFDQARDLVEVLRNDPGPWGAWRDASYVEVHRAQGLHALGMHTEAAETFTRAITNLAEDHHRDRGVYLARAAAAHAGAGSPEPAAAAGMQAVAIAGDTQSGRILQGLVELDRALAQWKQVPQVMEFRAAFNDMILHEKPESPTS